MIFYAILGLALICLQIISAKDAPIDGAKVIRFDSTFVGLKGSPKSMSSLNQMNYTSNFEDLLVRDLHRKDELLREASGLRKLILTDRQVCDLELILNGGFSPLKGFLGKEDYIRVCKETRLADGSLWPIPITLDISKEELSDLNIQAGETRIVLVSAKDPERPLAIMDVNDIFGYDKMQEALDVYATMDKTHPAVDYLLNKAKEILLGGNIDAIQLPKHYDFEDLRKTPTELRKYFADQKWNHIVAFQTRNPIHRAHKELTVRAATQLGAKLLIHPVVGMTKAGDVDYKTRVEAYQAILNRYPAELVTLSLLPLAMRMGGPREVLLHAIIRKNYGCTHLIVGRDHAGPGSDSTGKPFYGSYEAQNAALYYENEIGINVVPFQMMVYCPKTDEYIPEGDISPDKQVLNISGTELRRRLQYGLEIPEWFSYPEVVKILRRAYPTAPTVSAPSAPEKLLLAA